MTIRIKVSNRARLQRLARRLREAGAGGLQRRLVEGVVDEAQPALAAVRAAWLGVEVSSEGSGGSSSGLRARTAAATDVEPTGRGVRFAVDGAQIDPAYGRSLAWYLNGVGRWRHPVFGNTNAWTTQRGETVFAPTLRAHEPLWLARLERVCDEVAREIEG